MLDARRTRATCTVLERRRDRRVRSPCASVSAMLCVGRRAPRACFWPTIRAIACLTRSRSAVNGVAGAPRPKPATATRSDGDRRSMNALAAWRSPSRRRSGCSAGRRRSRSAGRRSRFRSCCSRPAAAAAAAPPARAPSGTHSAVTTRRGVAVDPDGEVGRRQIRRSACRGRRRRSTSSDVTSTDDWKLGFGGGCCAAPTRAEPAETAQHAERRTQRRLSLRARVRPPRLLPIVICPPARGSPAARGRRGGRRRRP